MEGGTRCKLCWYGMEHICWLNGFKSSTVHKMSLKPLSCCQLCSRYYKYYFSRLIFPLSSTGELFTRNNGCRFYISTSSTVVWGWFDAFDLWWKAELHRKGHRVPVFYSCVFQSHSSPFPPKPYQCPLNPQFWVAVGIFLTDNSAPVMISGTESTSSRGNVKKCRL